MSIVQEKLDEVLWPDMTVRNFVKEIYSKAISDRIDAKKLFDEIFERHKKANEEKEEKDKVNPAEDLSIVISTYMRLMKESNNQLIEVCKIIERILNTKILDIGKGSSSDPIGEYSSELSFIMNNTK